jgi:hypothetical protein
LLCVLVDFAILHDDDKILVGICDEVDVVEGIAIDQQQTSGSDRRSFRWASCSSEPSTTDRYVGQPHMAMPAHDSPAWNPTPHTRAVNTMRLLNQVQRRVGLNYSVRSMAERRRAANVCDKGECARSAKGRQLIQPCHATSSLVSELHLAFASVGNLGPESQTAQLV